MQSLPANPKKDDDAPYPSPAQQANGLLANVPRISQLKSAEEAAFLSTIAADDQRTKIR